MAAPETLGGQFIHPTLHPSSTSRTFNFLSIIIMMLLVAACACDSPTQVRTCADTRTAQPHSDMRRACRCEPPMTSVQTSHQKPAIAPRSTAAPRQAEAVRISRMLPVDFWQPAWPIKRSRHVCSVLRQKHVLRLARIPLPHQANAEQLPPSIDHTHALTHKHTQSA